MLHLLHTTAAFVIVIGVLVFVHELGHYLAARWRGVQVEVFSLGIGQRLFGWTDRAGTRWQVALIPIGGYVRMLGQSDLGPDDAPSPSARLGHNSGSGSFADKSVASRAIIVAAGPVFNFVLAVLLFATVYAISGRPSDSPVVAGVIPGSPAASAGFATGDAILRIDGTRVAHVRNVPSIVSRHGGERIAVDLRRAGHDLTLFVTPQLIERGGHPVGQLGIEVGASLKVTRLSPPAALWQGAADTVEFGRQILINLWRIVSGQGGTGQLGGPLRIAQVSGQAASAGPGSLVFLIAMISVNLGLVNLLPVPVLDGGHLVFYAIEAVLGRPLSRRAQALGLQAGLALIASLFLFVTFNDLTSFGLFRWMQSLRG